MGLLNGAVACTRFTILNMPEEIPFDQLPFRAITPGSAIRERSGVVPYKPEEPFLIGAGRWAFRVRIDKVLLDSTLINERLMELIKVEEENVGPPSPQTRRQLRKLAEDELMEHPSPKSKIIECYIENLILYVGSTSKGHIGAVLELLQRVGIEVEYKTPWIDRGLDEPPNEIVDMKEPGQSIWGCRFLQKLMGDPETIVEPEKGSVKLVTGDGTKVTLAGPVTRELDRLLDSGSEMLSAKVLVKEVSFSLDGLTFRISGFKLDNFKTTHWIEQLEERMEHVKGLWGLLDHKFEMLMADELPQA
ncbi:Recombination-associated protein RdgC [Sulfidibacter corallicola]|uniref:Uncharacterized protein n=1 Tax=Sulfidibacter corallicola TaxID=2818388 RepID=A0A8A4TWS3_SULCO|nr:hypothetical protein [Sulfidibacter corallicola]QTD53933.1 hypothetical protein J3U87_15905 [Sulfidibacter corallicola]